MSKRIMSILMILSLLVVAAVPTSAADEPSSWAVEEVTLAREENLIPAVLDVNYQQNIKRYEYVLLALQLIELNYDQVEIKQKYPFTDITNHPYEDEIVAAYNAGIIKGDGNGTFRPDDTITRQEIASLVYNLVKRLRDTQELSSSIHYSYSDAVSIGSWAIGYIDFCYQNDIMKGVGTDASGKSIINPKGNATREQAILLLYRLGSKEGIFANYTYPAIKVRDGNIYRDSELINDFAQIMGSDLAEKVIDLSNETTISVTYIDEHSIALEYNSQGSLKISKTNGKVRIDVYLNKLSNLTMLNDLDELGRLVGTDDVFEDAINRSINGFVNKDTYYFQEYISENELLTAQGIETSDGVIYQINYLR